MWKPFPVDGNGAAEGIRTPNPQIRSLMLYPIELRPHAGERVGSLKAAEATRKRAAFASASGAAARAVLLTGKGRLSACRPRTHWIHSARLEGLRLARNSLPGRENPTCTFQPPA